MAKILKFVTKTIKQKYVMRLERFNTSSHFLQRKHRRGSHILAL